MKTGKVRWLASEKIALRLLEKKGFRVVEVRRKINIDGVDVGEVDAVVIDDKGERYAVEIKAGRIDVHGIRQAVVNAMILGAKPLIVCKGYADDAAETLARKLNVTVITYEDVFLVDSEELEFIVETATLEALSEVLELIFSPNIKIKPGDIEKLRAIANSSDIFEAAKMLNTTTKELALFIKGLHTISKIAKRGWRGVQLVASLLLLRAIIEARLNSLLNSIEKLEKYTRELG
jgi:predicted RecB family endonuclease